MWSPNIKEVSLSGSKRTAPCVTTLPSSSHAPSVKTITGQRPDQVSTFLGSAVHRHEKAAFNTLLKLASITTMGPRLASLDTSWIASWVHLPKVCPAAYSNLPFSVSKRDMGAMSLLQRSSTNFPMSSTLLSLLRTRTTPSAVRLKSTTAPSMLNSWEMAVFYPLTWIFSIPTVSSLIQLFATKSRRGNLTQADKSHQRSWCWPAWRWRRGWGATLLPSGWKPSLHRHTQMATLWTRKTRLVAARRSKLLRLTPMRLLGPLLAAYKQLSNPAPCPWGCTKKSAWKGHVAPPSTERQCRALPSSRNLERFWQC